MPVNQYDNTTQTDGNINDQAARVETEQRNTNTVQQQAHSAQQNAAPDLSVQMQQDQQQEQLRKQQSFGMSMSVW